LVGCFVVFYIVKHSSYFFHLFEFCLITHCIAETSVTINKLERMWMEMVMTYFEENDGSCCPRCRTERIWDTNHKHYALSQLTQSFQLLL
jgi:hypothetical protein